MSADLRVLERVVKRCISRCISFSLPFKTLYGSGGGGGTAEDLSIFRFDSLILIIILCTSSAIECRSF